MMVYFAEGMKLTVDSLIHGPMIGMIKFFPLYGILLLVLIAVCLLCFFAGMAGEYVCVSYLFNLF